MSSETAEVVIVGGGIVGVSTAYLLGRAGIKSVVVERDSIGSHASGFAYGGLGAGGVPEPMAPIAREGWRLHSEFAKTLPESTGINFDFRYELKASLPWRQGEPGAKVSWLSGDETRDMEPRVSPEVIGALVDERKADLEPYRLSLALTQEAEKLGATVRHGNVTGLKREGGKVKAVVLERAEIACDRVVLALGPWSAEASEWPGVRIEVRPLKGQILRLQAPDAPVKC